MNYNKLFNNLIVKLLKFISNSNIDNEIVAEQYRRKFTSLLIDIEISELNKNDNVYNSLFDVTYNNIKSHSLITSKYPKLVLTYILNDLFSQTGLSINDFLKLTLEETDILIETVMLKQNIKSLINQNLQDELELGE